MRGSAGDFEAGTVWGTRNVVRACREHGVRKLVYVSSMGVLDHAGRKPGMVVTEDYPVEPHPDLRGAYTRTKLAAEREVRDAIRDHALPRSEEHTSELQSLMRISYAVFCLKKKKTTQQQ